MCPARTRALFGAALSLLLAVSAAACRNERAVPAPVAPAADSSRRVPVEDDDPAREPRPAGSASRVILIGLDGADWSILDRLAAAGRMPNVARLKSEGRTARLKSFIPPLSPVVWATMMTGATPEVHGVLDFQEVDPGTRTAVPISGRSRRVPAIWNLASAAGRRVGAVGFWATHPAEEVNGFFVSDRASSILFEGSLDGAAYPTALAAGVAQIVGSEGRIPDGDLVPYFALSAAEVARGRERGGGLENPFFALSKVLSATRATQRIARDLYDRDRPDLTAVYFEGTDVVGHVFAAYVPPRLACVSAGDFQAYAGTADAYYAFVDRLLGQWMRRASEDAATLVIVSDHGFKWEEDRTCQRSSVNWATAGFWHRLDGVFLAWGARVSPSPARGDASIYDVVPTLCALLGLPVDPKMTGKPLISLFSGLSAPGRRDLFSTVKVARIAAAPATAAERNETAERLRALGYLTGQESKRPAAVEEGPWPGRTEGAWNNLGLYQREAGRLGDGEKSFRKALELNPRYSSPMFNLSVLERTQGRYAEGSSWLFRSLEAGHPEPEKTILQWIEPLVKEGRRPAAAAALVEGCKRYPGSESLAVGLARLRFEGRDCAGAADALRPFTGSSKTLALNLLGMSELCLGHSEAARQLLQRSLSLDPAQQPIREALALLEAQGARR